MAGDASGVAGIEPDSAWDRYAHWQRNPARLLLLAMVLILIAAALVPINAGPSTIKTRNFVEVMVNSGNAPEKKRDEDLALYDRAIERIARGENYYDFIVEEHRKANYPVRPGLAVRLPTLAYVEAWIGLPGQFAAAIALMLATIWAWWRRLGTEPGGKRYQAIGTALIFVGTSLGLNRYFFVLHELWAGMLLALAFGLHRPGKWGWSLAAAALALAIREHSLPFVLLMAAMAFWRRDWKEGAAWSGLAAVFLAGLAWHLGMVSAQTLPSDPLSPSWLTFRGLSGWLSNVVLSSNVRFLPHWLAGPAVILMVFGWSGWKTAAGEFGTLLFLGYGLLFMIAGRGDNFYWGAAIAPAMFLGLAFAPASANSLLRAARGAVRAN
ncbi:MAG: hypothetical protein AB7F98_14620 [Novosphingobium sp.]